MPRQALHAKTLSFIHPHTGQWVHFNSSLPDDFMTILNKFAEFTKVELVSEVHAHSTPAFH
jgi:23S rRNA pseudouridine1911/1915/1917 synthase